ncbi:MAG TPA: hypothetical protein VFW25_07240 [Silvibacterium sp.]|nr:hypothetical protein [Silvibacterium sp.]
MSAALTLPYVWATASGADARSENTPIEGTAFYRRRTEKVLRRYLRASLAVGRVPSFANSLVMRGRATSYRLKNFEDVVIFAIDVEKCLKTLDAQGLQVVVRIAIQDYLLMDVAQQLCLDARTVNRKYRNALDLLTVQFLRKGILEERR